MEKSLEKEDHDHGHVEPTASTTQDRAVAAQGGSFSWDLSQERQFIENLLCERFNFLLLFYSIVITGAFATHSQTNFAIVLTLGALICSLFTLPIARAQHKLDLILKEIGKSEPPHPARRTDEWAVDLNAVPKLMRWAVRSSRRRMIGYWIPLLCLSSLWVGAVLSWFCVLRVEK